MTAPAARGCTGRTGDPCLGELDFELPSSLVAHEPPEARGLARDDVRLMVSTAHDDVIVHARFHDLPRFIRAGDILVVNQSATTNAAVHAWRSPPGGQSKEPVELHVSSPDPAGREGYWVVEVRRVTLQGTAPLLSLQAGERLRLAAGASATLIQPFSRRPPNGGGGGGIRLWLAELAFPGGVPAYLAAQGSPIRYDYVPERWPLDYYQTVFATEPGSAEMPSAGRAFSRSLINHLKRRGVEIAGLVLHTGVASLEADESPYPERYRVPQATAEAINRARARGGRLIAVGTTVVRALETVAGPGGQVRLGQGWTDLVITPELGLRAVDGLLTGFHEPRASHLHMLEALAGRRHLDIAYRAALSRKYLWHEFGDLHLILPTL
jgi:S-adenosylmethionine:tRNA ribosyltransferase-isomerase